MALTIEQYFQRTHLPEVSVLPQIIDFEDNFALKQYYCNMTWKVQGRPQENKQLLDPENPAKGIGAP